MKPHKYPLLLAAMDQKQISREDVAKVLKIAPNTWTHMVRGDAELTLPMAYKVLNLLNVPSSEIYKYFPEAK